MIEVGVGLEADRHLPRQWAFLLRVSEPLIEHRIGLSRRFTLALEVTSPRIKVPIHLIAMREVERDGPVDLLQVEDRERLGDGRG